MEFILEGGGGAESLGKGIRGREREGGEERRWKGLKREVVEEYVHPPACTMLQVS